MPSASTASRESAAAVRDCRYNDPTRSPEKATEVSQRRNVILVLSLLPALGSFPPHAMFHAPNLTAVDIGFMIVRMAPQADPRSHPLPDCPDWGSADPRR